MGLLLSQIHLSGQTEKKKNVPKTKHVQVCVFHANKRKTHKARDHQMLSNNVLA